MSKALTKYISIKLCCIHYLDLTRINAHNLKNRSQVGSYFNIIKNVT